MERATLRTPVGRDLGVWEGAERRDDVGRADSDAVFDDTGAFARGDHAVFVEGAPQLGRSSCAWGGAVLLRGEVVVFR